MFLYAEAMTKHPCFLPRGVLEMCTDFMDANRREFQRDTLRSMVRLVPSSGLSMEDLSLHFKVEVDKLYG